MKEIIIFAGTCASGKTTVIKKIKQGKLPFGNQIRLDQSSKWDYYEGYKDYLEKIESNSFQSNQAIMHYDIYGQHIVMQKDFELLCEIINHFDKVSIVTLKTSNSTLKKRILMRLVKTIVRIILNPGNYQIEFFRCKRHYQVYKNYSNPNTLKDLYSDWFEYVRTLEVDKHWIVNSDRKDKYDVREAKKTLTLS